MDQNNEPSRITFAEDQLLPAKASNSGTPKLIQLAIKYSGGYVKDEKQATYVLLGFAVITVSISLLLLFSGDRTQEKPPTSVLQQMPVNR